MAPGAEGTHAMRIGILSLMAGRRAGGPETYEVSLIRALSRLDSPHEYFVYCTGPEAVEAIGPVGDNVTFRVLEPASRWLSLTVTLPRWLKRDRVDLLHATFAPPPFAGVKTVMTAHCLSSFTHPEFYPALVRWRLNALLSRGVRRAARVACVSATTLRDVQQRFGVPAERLAVTYNGVSPRFVVVPAGEARRRVAERLGISDPYVLYVGKIEARKNVARLVTAFARFRRAGGSRLRLVLAGRASDDVGLRQVIEQTGVQAHVTETGYVADDDLPALYSAARMFVFPSLWEGFGIPIVEAMACGTPVLASTAGCLPEIAGDAALLVDPSSEDAIADAMDRLDRSDNLRKTLIARGHLRTRQFTWENCARSTLAVYAEAGRSE